MSDEHRTFIRGAQSSAGPPTACHGTRPSQPAGLPITSTGPGGNTVSFPFESEEDDFDPTLLNLDVTAVKNGVPVHTVAPRPPTARNILARSQGPGPPLAPNVKVYPDFNDEVVVSWRGQNFDVDATDWEGEFSIFCRPNPIIKFTPVVDDCGVVIGYYHNDVSTKHLWFDEYGILYYHDFNEHTLDISPPWSPDAKRLGGRDVYLTTADRFTVWKHGSHLSAAEFAKMEQTTMPGASKAEILVDIEGYVLWMRLYDDPLGMEDLEELRDKVCGFLILVAEEAVLGYLMGLGVGLVLRGARLAIQVVRGVRAARQAARASSSVGAAATGPKTLSLPQAAKAKLFSTPPNLSGKTMTGMAVSTRGVGALPVKNTGRRTIIMADDMAEFDYWLAKAPTESGMYDVVIHGDPLSFHILRRGVWEKVSVSDVAKAIRSRLQPGDQIRLIACETGGIKGGPAQELANQLQRTVWAPNKTVYPSHGRVLKKDEYGRALEMSAEKSFVPDGGKFHPFYPEKKVNRHVVKRKTPTK